MASERSFQKLTENYLIVLLLLQQACSTIWLHSQPETSDFQFKYACGLSAATWYGIIQIHTHMRIYLKKKKNQQQKIIACEKLPELFFRFQEGKN